MDLYNNKFNDYTNYPGSNAGESALQSLAASMTSGLTQGGGISSLFKKGPISSYASLEMKNLGNVPGLAHQDFRAMRALNTVVNPLLIRVDGASALFRGSVKGGLYAAAAANPLGRVWMGRPGVSRRTTIRFYSEKPCCNKMETGNW